MLTLPALEKETLTGWGMRNAAVCRVARPQTVDGLHALVAHARQEGMTIGLRGGGNSYGDAAINAGQVVIESSGLNQILEWNAETGQITVEPGVTIAQIWRKTLPDGWWPAVVPGTSMVTAAGAAAANIHGKNNWHAGAFGDYVVSFDLLLASGETVRCSRDEHEDLFYAAIGSMGLLGIFTRLTLQARRIYSGNVREVQTTHGSLADLIAALEAASDISTDLVAWIDTGARNGELGRGLLRAGNDLREGEDSEPERSMSVRAQEHQSALMRMLPADLIPMLARPMTTPLGVWAANRAQWIRGQNERSSQPRLESYAAANFLLDAIPNWRKTYLPGGLIQHQSFIPRNTAPQAFREILERSHTAGIVPSLSVLKKHRPADEFLLSYLLDGYSLALDYPVRRGEEERVMRLMRTLYDVVVDYGGKLYFAKDSTATPDQAQRMLGTERINRFHELKRQYDPEGLFSSDLYRRVLA